MEEEYRQKLSAASETSERIVKEAVARGQHREEEIIRQANAEASAIMDKAAADIAMEKKKLGMLIFGILMAVLGLFGGLQALGILSGVPIFAFGIPAVLSLYFDFFSGFVQALVFSLLSMVYIAGSCPPPEEAQA